MHRPHCVNPANGSHRGRQVLDVEVTINNSTHPMMSKKIPNAPLLDAMGSDKNPTEFIRALMYLGKIPYAQILF